MNLQDFICPVYTYRGEPIPSHQEFNTHLQIFCCRASLLCSLQTNGKISPTDALRQLTELWEQLQPYTTLIEDEEGSSSMKKVNINEFDI